MTYTIGQRFDYLHHCLNSSKEKKKILISNEVRTMFSRINIPNHKSVKYSLYNLKYTILPAGCSSVRNIVQCFDWTALLLGPQFLSSCCQTLSPPAHICDSDIHIDKWSFETWLQIKHLQEDTNQFFGKTKTVSSSN